MRSPSKSPVFRDIIATQNQGVPLTGSDLGVAVQSADSADSSDLSCSVSHAHVGNSHDDPLRTLLFQRMALDDRLIVLMRCA